MRDFASVEQLIVLVNLESMNADMIRQNIPAMERLEKLRSVAYYQLKSLLSNDSAKKLKATIQNRIEQKGINSKRPLLRQQERLYIDFLLPDCSGRYSF